MEAFTPEESARIRELLEIEAIRKTRVLYAQLLDSGRIDDLAELFTKDAVCEFGPYGRWEGRDAIRAKYYEIEEGKIFGAMHHTCNHWVELTGEATAVGRSYLLDVLTERAPDENPIVWFAVYEDEYVKRDGQWLFARCSLQFLWPKRRLSEGFPGPFPPTERVA